MSPEFAALRYDPFGRLYEVTDGQGNIRRFLHDGDDLVAEYGPSGTMLARHLHGLGAGDDPLVTFSGANASYLDAEYLYTDRLGSVIARFRRDRMAVAINGYDEFGVPGSTTGIQNNGRFRYTGQVWLPELGLYYYKARMYSPTIGRFMQTDPIGYADGMNMYAYVGNDPVNFVDPTGRTSVSGSDSPIVVQGHKSCPTGWSCYSGEALRELLRGMQLEVVDRAVFDQFEFFSVEISVVAEEPQNGKPLWKRVACKIGNIDIGGGADGYAGLGASVGGSIKLDLTTGQTGIDGYTAVGVGLGIEAGPTVTSSGSGNSIITANVITQAGGGYGVGVVGTRTLIGTNPGQNSVTVGKVGSPIGFVNGGAAIGFHTPALWDLGC